MIYLDNNATTAPTDRVVRAVESALRSHWANPSSLHPPGEESRAALECARADVARALGASPREVIFTSGGTESCNLALRGSRSGEPARRVVATARSEHAAVRECAAAFEAAEGVAWLDLDPAGLVDLASLDRLLAARSREIAVVSVMWANNESGVLQPVQEVAALCRRHGVRFHTDATQCLGRIPISVADIGCDLLSVSAHKVHGPKGVGALYCRRGVALDPAIIGGPQERNRRGGTENAPGIAGFAAACSEAVAWLASGDCPWDGLARGRDRFERQICTEVPGAVVLSVGQRRLWNTSLVAFPRLQSEAVLVELARLGVAASAGAACSSGSSEPSPVLLAMGVPHEVAHGAVRFSLSRFTTADELDQAATRVVRAVQAVARSMA